MRRQRILAVARWEYQKLAKPRDLFLGGLFFAVVVLGFAFVKHLDQRKATKEHVVAVHGGESIGLAPLEELGRFRLESQTGRSVQDLCEALEQEEIDGLLVVGDDDAAELQVRKASPWNQEFLLHLRTRTQTSRLHQLDLTSEELAKIVTPLPVDVITGETGNGGGSSTSTLTVLIVVGGMMLGLFLGFSYIFVAITGEKTQHVTESVLSAITPQEWIDGKIIGLTGVVLVTVLTYALGFIVARLVGKLLFDQPLNLPLTLGDPLTFGMLLLFAVLGYAFWFTFFVVVAATISDPNSSSRSSIMMLPFAPLALVFLGMDAPDGPLMRALSLLPGTSSAGMPMRMLAGDPGWWEIAAALVLLIAATNLLRRAAGKIFGTIMLMTGKEPSWREVWRWVRA